MFSNLTEFIKSRLIQEIKYFWSRDPNYANTLVPNIQGRFSFAERPQQAIVLKGGSANPFQFSSDHYQGMLISYCHLTKVYGQNGTSIEWVRENSVDIRRNNGEFPSPPGVYYVEIRKEVIQVKGEPSERLVFYVDPLLEVIDERAIKLDYVTYEVAAGSFHPGSLRVYEMPGNLEYYEGVNYTSDPSTGRITVLSPLSSNTYLSVDYRHPGTSVGPFPVPENGSNVEAIPGVVIAFGRRSFEGDIMAIVIGERREEVAKEYGGRWEMSIDLDIMARDLYAQGEITDRTLMFLYTEARERLSGEGINITEASAGGEAEETYDETGDDYYFTSSISVSVVTEWTMHVPVGYKFSRVSPNTYGQLESVAGMTDAEIAEFGTPSNLFVSDNLGLVKVRDPWFIGRSKNFEMIR